MAIHCITGLPGKGKTYYMSHLAERFLKQGRMIYANYHLNVPPEMEHLVHYWSNIYEINAFDEGVILMDEAQRYFNSRQWGLLSEDTEIKLQQHRKNGLDIYATTQHYTRLDVTLRILVHKFYVCTRFWKIIRIQEFYLEAMDKANTSGENPSAIWTDFILQRKKIYRFYDTNELVPKGKPAPLIHKERPLTTPLPEIACDP